METFDKGGYRQGNHLNLAGASKQKMFFIAGRDYGQQVVKAFLLNNDNQEYAIQGLEGFTTDEAAKIFANHFERAKIKIEKIPLWLLVFMGKFSRKYNYVANLVESLNDYPEKFESEKTWHDLNKPKTTFIEYIKNAD